MRNITLVAFISKSISLLLIIFLVKKPDDILYAILSISVGNLVGGLIGFFLLWKKNLLKAITPAKEYTISLFKESSYVFVSIILVPLYSSINIFILQAFTNPLMVGYYAVAVKIFDAIGMLSNIANRSLFPHLVTLYKTSITLYYQKIKKIILLFSLTVILLAIFQFIGAEELLRLISGKNYKYDLSYSAGILKIMSIGLLFSPFASFFFQLLILQGQKKRAIVNIAITVVINLLCGCFFAMFFSGKGMAINLCFIVFIIATLNYYAFANKLKLQLSAAH
jgi:PST family polysaccharide transporter